MDMLKYKKTISSENRLVCDHDIVELIYDFGDGFKKIKRDGFSIIRNDDSSKSIKDETVHLYSKKGEYTVILKSESTCPQYGYVIKATHVGLKDMVIVISFRPILELIWKNRFKIVRDVLYLIIRMRSHDVTTLERHENNINDSENSFEKMF